MKKNYLFLAATAVVMASCANEDFIGDTPTNLSESQAIGFSMSTPNATRADNSADAGKLGNMFIVWGEKNENSSGDAAGADEKVFQNYVVKYQSGTANTTTSNTKDWEYVGVDHSKYDTNVISTIGSGKAQTIKYWDTNASDYTFTAVSAKEEDIEKGCVKITKTLSGSSVYEKGYTIELKKVTQNSTDYYADASKVYVADRVNVTKPTSNVSATVATNHTNNTANVYGGHVKFTFRNFQSKIRFGIYETVPGYKVVITGIKYPDATNANTTIEHPTNPTSGEPDKTFGIGGDFVVAGDNTKYTVTYESTGTNVNRAKVAVNTNSSKEKSINTTGTSWLSTHFTGTNDKSFIGEDATNATFDKGTTNNYTAILPNPGNSTNLKLQISYDLYSDDTYEKIETGYHTVEVPAAYCQWKSNYAYTYLFKITDKSADLYPITFDACVVEEQTGNQETITTVDEPSITTYVKGKVQTAYAADDEIYAFGEDGSTTAMSSSNMKLYKVTTTDNFEITEASVKHALEQQSNNVTTKITATEIKSGDDNYTEQDKPTYVAIPREDSTDGRTITGMKWKAVTSTTYAVEYIVGSGDTAKKYYKIVKIAQ